jgi:DNA invertase Pin-like site-specific DNA recombinase
MPNSLPTYGYVRVSTDSQETDRQKDAIARACAMHGWTLEHIIEEPAGQSGRSDKVKSGVAEALAYYSDLAGERFGGIERSGYAEVLRLAGIAPVRFVFYALDRFARDSIELMLLELLLRKYNCVLVCLAEGGALDTATASGKFLFRVLAAKAELECDQTSERTSATLRRMVDRGEKVGRPPAGWRKNPVIGAWEHDPKTWPMVTRVSELRASGATYARIHAETGVTTGRIKAMLDAHAWDPTTGCIAAGRDQDVTPNCQLSN